MEKYLDKNSVMRLLQGVKTQIDKSKASVLDAKGAANGIASLDENGNVPLSQLGNVDTVLFEIVHVLPTELTEQQKNHIFIVPRGLESESDKNTYKEYIYTGNDIGHIAEDYWEELGEFTSEVDLKPYSKKSEAVTAIRFTSENSNGTSDSASPDQNLLIEFADGHHVVVDVPIAGADGYTSSGHGYIGNCGFMTNSDKSKLDKIDINSLTASINAANTAAANTKKAIQAAETATAGAEKVDATLTEENVFEVTDRTGVKKTLDMSGLVSAQSDVARIQESMGIYSDRPNITLVAKETNKAISADGIKVTKAGWAIAEFTAELGNIYLFNPGETSSDVCVFAEYIDKVETRAIDYAYAYDESGRVLTAKATYNGKTYTYTYDYSTDETVITDQDNNKVSSLPSVYTTIVGAYNPMTILNADAELPQDGYCRFVSNFTTASSIRIVVSYKIASANLAMKVVRDGSTANMCSQLAKINKKVDDVSARIPDMWVDICATKRVAVTIDGKLIWLNSGVNYRFENVKSIIFGKNGSALLDYVKRVAFHYNKMVEMINFQVFSIFTPDTGIIAQSSLKNLTELDVSAWDTSNFKFNRNFTGLYKIKKLDVASWNTSNATSFWQLFSQDAALEELDVSAWDTSNVTNMSGTFNACSSLKELDVSAWDTSNVTNMSGTFWLCGTSVLDVSNWNTSKCTSLERTFCNTMITKLDLSNWNTSNVSSVKEFLLRALYIKTLTFGENFGRMKDECSTLDLSSLHNWKDDSVKTLLSLYDRKANGMGVITIKLHTNTKAVLGEDGIAQLTAKGYTIA